jgi:IQ calmodulin-binding motif
MKSITYIKTNPTIRVLNFRQTTEKNFGTKSFLASEVNRQSSDNSMRKQILIKSLNKKKLSFLINNHEIAVERAKQAKLRCEIFKRYAGDLSAYKNKIKLSESRDLQMNKASIKIQKVVRGYLVRKSLENVS